jgi:hypothetical protein
MSLESGLDVNIQAPILNCPPAFGMLAPSIISATRHRKDPANPHNTPKSAVLVYESEYLVGSSEKMATAFLRYRSLVAGVGLHA